MCKTDRQTDRHTDHRQIHLSQTGGITDAMLPKNLLGLTSVTDPLLITDYQFAQPLSFYYI